MKKNPKNELIKTLTMFVLALATVGTTWGVFTLTQPTEPDEYAKVGKTFFASFETSQQIVEMELAALDTNGKLQTFNLKKQNGLWTIPTHYDYPAEANDRLSQTATDLIGLQRRALASAEKAAHDRLGVLDPTQEAGQADPENAGKLIRFRDQNGDAIFELLLGKAIQTEAAPESIVGVAEPQEKLFNVRVPAENETYVAKLDLDISTKFSDWINRDLLELDTASLRQVKVDNYRLESQQVLTNQGIAIQKKFIPGEELELLKTEDFGEWKIADLNPEKEKVDSETVNQLIGTIEQIELAGVRPRFKYQGQAVMDENFAVKVPESIANDPQAQQAVFGDLQDDLANRGFALAQDPDTSDIILVSEHGELAATNNQGLTYTLYFGSQISGEQQDIEIGKTDSAEKAADGQPTAAPDTEKSDTGEPNPESADGADSADGVEGEAKTDAERKESDPLLKNKSRFLLVKVDFDPARVEGKPVEPSPPQRMEIPPGFGDDGPAAGENTGPAGVAVPNTDAPPVPALDVPATETPATETPATDTPATDTPATETPGGNQIDLGSEDAAAGQASEDVDSSPSASETAVGGNAGLFSIQDQEPVTPELSPESPASQSGTQPGAQPGTQPAAISRQQIEQAMEGEYQRQLQAFEAQQKQYAEDLQAYQEQVEKYREKAARLNERFADWYYVVPASDLEDLRLTRAQVVQPAIKENAEGQIENPIGIPQLPPTSFPEQ